MKRITTYRNALQRVRELEKCLAEIAHWLSEAPLDPQLSEEAERKLMLRKVEQCLQREFHND